MQYVRSRLLEMKHAIFFNYPIYPRFQDGLDRDLNTAGALI